MDACYKERKEALRIVSSVEVSEACTRQSGQGIRTRLFGLRIKGMALEQ